MTPIKKVNIADKFSQFSQYWTPHIIGELNNQHVKIAKVKGDFVSHKHDKEDELFFVVHGTLFMELETETIQLNPGELIIIPKGTLHRPYAPDEAHILLFEPATTLNTGDQINKLTQKNLRKI